VRTATEARSTRDKEATKLRLFASVGAPFAREGSDVLGGAEARRRAGGKNRPSEPALNTTLMLAIVAWAHTIVDDQRALLSVEGSDP
jgi:hypothetical protein